MIISGKEHKEANKQENKDNNEDKDGIIGEEQK